MSNMKEPPPDYGVQSFDRRTTERAARLRAMAAEIKEESPEAAAHMSAAADEIEGHTYDEDNYVIRSIARVSGQDWEVTLMGELWSLIEGCDYPALRRIVTYLTARVDELETAHKASDG